VTILTLAFCQRLRVIVSAGLQICPLDIATLLYVFHLVLLQPDSPIGEAHSLAALLRETVIGATLI
jgi:hypothetical protein